MDKVKCPNCGSERTVKNGKSFDGRQRYCCKEKDCFVKTFQLDYLSVGCLKKFISTKPKIWRVRPFQLDEV